MSRLWQIPAFLAALLLATHALAEGRQARIGFVSWYSRNEAAHVEYLRQGLKQRGWTEGHNIRIEAHFTEGDEAATRHVLAALVDSKVDVLVVRATNVAHLAKRATTTIPIVMMVSDPLATGLVNSLARPEGNITGLSLQGPDLSGKRLEYILALKPGLRRVGFLGASTDPNGATFVRHTQEAAERLGLQLVTRMIAGPRELSADVFAAFAREGVEAIIVQPIFTGYQDKIVAGAMAHRIPVVSNYPVFAQAGAVVTLGPDDAAQTRRAAYFIDRILRGAAPSDLPVEQPSRFTLTLNLRAARRLDLTVPASLRLAADEIIE